MPPLKAKGTPSMANTRALQTALQALAFNGVRGDYRRLLTSLEQLSESAPRHADPDLITKLVDDVTNLVRNASDEVGGLRKRVREPWRR